MRTAPTLRRLPLAAAAIALLATSTAASAVDWEGYFRAGPGATKKNTARACYGLAGPGLKYRLGNECDFYGEFLLSQGAEVEGVKYKAALMTNLFNPGTDSNDAKLGINQMYLEGTGYDIAPGATFWIGKRFYGRADVHIVDTFYVNMSGVGAGAYGFQAGPGKIGVAYFRTDSSDGVGAGLSDDPGTRVNAEYYDVEVNPGGKLRVVGTFTDGNFDEGKSGFGLTLEHKQANALGLGGNNTLWLQTAQGSTGLDANFGNLRADSSAKGWRIVDGFDWQVGAFGGQAQVLYQQDKDSDGVKAKSATIGGRVSYAFTKNFKLVSELGYSQRKVDGSATQKLAKFTIAPTLSTGPGFWKRPELRLYVTTAKWNNAANEAAGPGGLTGIGDGKTRGTSYGAQVEIWF